MLSNRIVSLILLSFCCFACLGGCDEIVDEQDDLIDLVTRYSSLDCRLVDVSYYENDCQLSFSNGKSVLIGTDSIPVFSYDDFGFWLCNSKPACDDENVRYPFDGSVPKIDHDGGFWFINGYHTDVPHALPNDDSLCITHVYINRQKAFFYFSDGTSVSIKKGPLGGIKPYFQSECLLASEKIKAITDTSNCLVLSVFSDIHEKANARNYVDRTNQTLHNISELGRQVAIDGVVFLGDALWPDDETLYPDRNAVTEHLSSIRSRLLQTNDRVYLMLGNHDGLKGSVPVYSQMDYEFWFNSLDSYVTRPFNCPWYYFDDERTRVRSIVLAAPDPLSGENVWSYSQSQLKWLAEVALQTEDGWSVLLFSHTHPYCVTEDYPMVRHDVLSGILNAYNRHEQFFGEDISADYSSYTDTRIAALIVGHAHEDNTIERGNPYFRNYDLDFPTAVIDKSMTSGQKESTGKSGAISSSRVLGTKTQDLWDTLVYDSKNNMIRLIRFGAGEDRTLELSR